MFSKSIHTLIRKEKKFALSLRVLETCSINLDDELKTSSMFDQGGEFRSMRSNPFLTHNIGVVHTSFIGSKWNLNMKLPVWPTNDAEKFVF